MSSSDSGLSDFNNSQSVRLGTVEEFDDVNNATFTSVVQQVDFGLVPMQDDDQFRSSESMHNLLDVGEASLSAEEYQNTTDIVTGVA
jgi:hypothetical protein